MIHNPSGRAHLKTLLIRNVEYICIVKEGKTDKRITLFTIYFGSLTLNKCSVDFYVLFYNTDYINLSFII